MENYPNDKHEISSTDAQDIIAVWYHRIQNRMNRFSTLERVSLILYFGLSLILAAVSVVLTALEVIVITLEGEEETVTFIVIVSLQCFNILVIVFFALFDPKSTSTKAGTCVKKYDELVRELEVVYSTVRTSESNNDYLNEMLLLYSAKNALIENLEPRLLKFGRYHNGSEIITSFS